MAVEMQAAVYSAEKAAAWKDPVFQVCRDWLATTSPGRLSASVSRVSLTPIRRPSRNDNPYSLTEWNDDDEEEPSDHVSSLDTTESKNLWKYLKKRFGNREAEYFSSWAIDSPVFTAELYTSVGTGRDAKTVTVTVATTYSQIDLWNRKRILDELTRRLAAVN